MNQWLLLSVGGILGTLARYALGAWLPSLAGASFPFATLVVNLSACLAVGFLNGLAARGLIGPESRLFLMTGFCGAYSTFSTWILESSSLAADGETLRVLANLLGSVGFGFLLFRLGVYLGTVL